MKILYSDGACKRSRLLDVARKEVDENDDNPGDVIVAADYTVVRGHRGR